MCHMHKTSLSFQYWINYASVRFNLNLKFNETWNWRKSNLRKSVRRPVTSKGPSEHCQINWVNSLWWVQSAPMRGIGLSSKSKWKQSPTVPVCSTGPELNFVPNALDSRLGKRIIKKKSALGADDNEKSDSLPQAQLDQCHSQVVLFGSFSYSSIHYPCSENMG